MKANKPDYIFFYFPYVFLSIEASVGWQQPYVQSSHVCGFV